MKPLHPLLRGRPGSGSATSPTDPHLQVCTATGSWHSRWCVSWCRLGTCFPVCSWIPGPWSFQPQSRVFSEPFSGREMSEWPAAHRLPRSPVCGLEATGAEPAIQEPPASLFGSCCGMPAHISQLLWASVESTAHNSEDLCVLLLTTAFFCPHGRVRREA